MGPLVIAGSRGFRREAFDLYMAEREWPKGKPREVVSGTAAGPDTYGAEWAKREGIHVKEFPADWNKHGKRAGPIRNRQMAEYAAQHGGGLLAFWDGQSRGTASMIAEARALGLPVVVVRP